MDRLIPKQDEIRAFRSQHARKVRLAIDLLDLASICCAAFVHANWQNHVQPMIVQNIYQYFQESITFSMRNEANLALAMMRMASEGFRDLCRILDTPDLAVRWASEAEFRQKRAAFRFDGSNPTENMMHTLYKLGSNFGIHGKFKFLEGIGRIEQEDDQNFVAFRPDRKTSLSTFMLALDAILLSQSELMIKARHQFDKSPHAIIHANAWKKEFDAIESDYSSYRKIYYGSCTCS